MDPHTNPFAVLSLIVAPAVLTNACSLLAMSTSNRLARASDHARELARQLEAGDVQASPEARRRLRDLAATEHRTLMLLFALRCFYMALGGFALSALVSLAGAALLPLNLAGLVPVVATSGVVVGVLAVAALVCGMAVLLRETRIAVRAVEERARSARKRIAELEERTGR